MNFELKDFQTTSAKNILNELDEARVADWKSQITKPPLRNFKAASPASKQTKLNYPAISRRMANLDCQMGLTVQNLKIGTARSLIISMCVAKRTKAKPLNKPK